MVIANISGGGGDTTELEDDTKDEQDDGITATVTPTGARNPFNYNTDGDGGLEETTLGGNTVADVDPNVDYSDTSVDEQASTQDAPESTQDVIDAAASGGSNPSFDSTSGSSEDPPLEDVDAPSLSDIADAFPTDRARTAAALGLGGLALAAAVRGGGN